MAWPTQANLAEVEKDLVDSYAGYAVETIGIIERALFEH